MKIRPIPATDSFKPRNPLETSVDFIISDKKAAFIRVPCALLGLLCLSSLTFASHSAIVFPRAERLSTAIENAMPGLRCVFEHSTRSGDGTSSIKVYEVPGDFKADTGGLSGSENFRSPGSMYTRKRGLRRSVEKIPR